jgi:peptidoglycan/LPS O-acetylase OafA/YrhL
MDREERGAESGGTGSTARAEATVNLSTAASVERDSLAPPRSLAGRLLARLSRETSSGRFIPEMDGLRFAAIGMVILFHLNGYLIAKSPLYRTAPPQSDWLAQAALVGFRGVELFFVISGFILGLPFAAHRIHRAPRVRLRKYYLRRLTRLEPPYFAAVFLLFFLALWIQGRSAASLYPHLCASLVYLQSLIYGATSPFIGVAWSLEIEVQFYLLVPLLTLLFAVRERRLRRILLVALILAILSAQSVFLHQAPRASLSILAYLQFFLIGFLLADVFISDWQEAPRQNLAWDLVALAGWPLLFVILHSEVLTHWVFPAWVFLLYCAAFRGRFVNRFFSNRWIAAAGGMCYSIYLLHYDVISGVGRFTRGIASGAPYWVYLLVQLGIVGAMVVAVCGVYFVMIEKPCMRRDWPQRFWNYGQRTLFARFRPTRTGVAQ